MNTKKFRAKAGAVIRAIKRTPTAAPARQYVDAVVACKEEGASKDTVIAVLDTFPTAANCSNREVAAITQLILLASIYGVKK